MAEKLGNILPVRLRKYGIEEHIGAAQIIDVVRSIIVSFFPESHAKRIRPLYVKNGLLYLQVDSSVLAQQVLFLQNDFLLALRKKMPNARVTGLRTKLP